jgi:ribosomal RNA-processing protein 12
MPGATRLFVVLLSLVVDDVVEAELVDTLGGGDDAEPVTELLLLEVLLGEVLQVAAGEGDVGNNLDLAIAGLGDHDVLTEVTNTALDLDAVVEELLEGRDIEDLVASGLRSVDNELLGNLLGLATTSLYLMELN